MIFISQTRSLGSRGLVRDCLGSSHQDLTGLLWKIRRHISMLSRCYGMGRWSSCELAWKEKAADLFRYAFAKLTVKALGVFFKGENWPRRSHKDLEGRSVIDTNVVKRQKFTPPVPSSLRRATLLIKTKCIRCGCDIKEVS